MLSFDRKNLLTLKEDKLKEGWVIGKAISKLHRIEMITQFFLIRFNILTLANW